MSDFWQDCFYILVAFNSTESRNCSIVQAVMLIEQDTESLTWLQLNVSDSSSHKRDIAADIFRLQRRMCLYSQEATVSVGWILHNLLL